MTITETLDAYELAISKAERTTTISAHTRAWARVGKLRARIERALCVQTTTGEHNEDTDAEDAAREAMRDGGCVLESML